jgi:hypothetical protein
MNKLSSFPDLDRGMIQWGILMKLENISDKTLLGYCIRQALISKTAASKIFKTIMDAHTDNPSVVYDVVGYDLFNQIKSLYGTK